MTGRSQKTHLRGKLSADDAVASQLNKSVFFNTLLEQRKSRDSIKRATSLRERTADMSPALVSISKPYGKHSLRSEATNISGRKQMCFVLGLDGRLVCTGQRVVKKPMLTVNDQNFIVVYVVGAKHAGKSALIKYFVSGSSDQSTYNISIDSSDVPYNSLVSSITVQGTELSVRYVEINFGDDINLAEELANHINSNYDQLVAILAVYSVTDHSSFEGALYFIRNLDRLLMCNAPIFLIGNKMDLERQREVHSEEGLSASKAVNNGHFAEITVEFEHDIDKLLCDILQNLLFSCDNSEQRYENIRALGSSIKQSTSCLLECLRSPDKESAAQKLMTTADDDDYRSGLKSPKTSSVGRLVKSCENLFLVIANKW